MPLELATAFVRVKVDRTMLRSEIQAARSQIVRGLSGIRVPIHLDMQSLRQQATAAGRQAGTALRTGMASRMGGAGGVASGLKPLPGFAEFRAQQGGGFPFFIPPMQQAGQQPVPAFPGVGSQGPAFSRFAGGGLFMPGSQVPRNVALNRQRLLGKVGRRGGFFGGGRFSALGEQSGLKQFGLGAAFRVAPMATALGAFGGKAGLAGFGAAAGVLGGAGLAGAGIKTFADFEETFRDVEIVQKEAGATQEEIARLEEQTRSLAQTTIFTAEEGARAMAVLTRRGFDAVQVFKQMPNVLSLAAAGQLDVADAAGVVAATQKQFQLEAEETQQIADILAKASLNAATDVRELGHSLSFVGPIANVAGKELDETVAAVMALRDAGLDASRAGTGLSRVLTKMSEPRIQEMFHDIGVEVETVEGNLKPLPQILDETSKALEGMTQVQRTAFAIQAFGRRGGPAFGALLGQGGDALRENLAELQQAMGTAENVATERLDSINQQLELLGANLKELGITFGEIFEDDARLAIDATTDAVKGLTNELKGSEESIRSILGVDLIDDLGLGEGDLEDQQRRNLALIRQMRNRRLRNPDLTIDQQEAAIERSIQRLQKLSDSITKLQRENPESDFGALSFQIAKMVENERENLKVIRQKIEARREEEEQIRRNNRLLLQQFDPLLGALSDIGGRGMNLGRGLFGTAISSMMRSAQNRFQRSIIDFGINALPFPLPNAGVFGAAANAFGGLQGMMGLAPAPNTREEMLKQLRGQVEGALRNQELQELRGELGIDDLLGRRRRFRPRMMGIPDLHRSIQLGVLRDGEDQFIKSTAINTEKAAEILERIEGLLEDENGGGLK